MNCNPKISNWQGKRVWLLGASTGIGAALAKQLSAAGACLAISARQHQALADLALPGAKLIPLNVTNTETLSIATQQLLAEWGTIDLVIYLAGDYRPMKAAEIDLVEMSRLCAVNYQGAVNLTATLMPEAIAGRIRGLAFMASVAGYRGLPNALAYGPPKAALIHLAEILHLELIPRKIGVWVINPGFVATRLTAQNTFSMPALITPEEAAKATLRGFTKGRFEIDFPRRFTRILRLITLLPYCWYFPLIRRITGLNQ